MKNINFTIASNFDQVKQQLQSNKQIVNMIHTFPNNPDPELHSMFVCSVEDKNVSNILFTLRQMKDVSDVELVRHCLKRDSKGITVEDFAKLNYIPES